MKPARTRPPVAPPKPAPARDTRLTPEDAARASLAATGGRYQDLCAWADAHGLTFTQAQQRWHRLGLPLDKGAR